MPRLDIEYRFQPFFDGGIRQRYGENAFIYLLDEFVKWALFVNKHNIKRFVLLDGYSEIVCRHLLRISHVDELLITLGSIEQPLDDVIDVGEVTFVASAVGKVYGAVVDEIPKKSTLTRIGAVYVV